MLGERLEAEALLCCPDRLPAPRLSDPYPALLLPTHSAAFHSQTQRTFLTVRSERGKEEPADTGRTPLHFISGVGLSGPHTR